MTYLIILFLFAVASCAPTVVSVHDGDSLTTQTWYGSTEKIRLNGIDAPELKQPYGQEARQLVIDLTLDKPITIHPHKTDRYRRIIADVTLPDGQNLSHELLKHGLAWWFFKYSKDPTLKHLQARAQHARRGLWHHPNPTPPWTYRQQKTHKKKEYNSAFPLDLHTPRMYTVFMDHELTTKGDAMKTTTFEVQKSSLNGKVVIDLIIKNYPTEMMPFLDDLGYEAVVDMMTTRRKRCTTPAEIDAARDPLLPFIGKKLSDGKIQINYN